MTRMLNDPRLVIAAIVFVALSILIKDIRHPYFNSAVFSAALTAQFLVFHFILANRHKPLPALVAYSGLGYLASVISFLLAWLWQGNSGVSLYISNFGPVDMLLNVLMFPVFSYAFLLFPAAAGLSWVVKGWEAG